MKGAHHAHAPDSTHDPAPDVLYRASLATGFAVAFAAAFPVSRWFSARGRGHALAHGRR